MSFENDSVVADNSVTDDRAAVRSYVQTGP